MNSVSSMPVLKFGVAVGIAAMVLASCSDRLVDSITGVVLDEAGEAVVGATVKVQATDRSAVSDEHGRFTLLAADLARVSAWAEGYFIGGGEEHPPGAEVTIDLARVPSQDNPEYEWMSALEGSGDIKPCSACHSFQGTDLVAAALPVDQWIADAHSGSASNPRFLSMYGGTDLGGNQSPLTRYVQNRDYGRVPLRPDLSAPYYGPGYKLDFPDSAGNCGACHVPAAAVDDPYGVDPRFVTGVGAEGVTCDLCHKVWDIALDASGIPEPAMPGVLSYEFRRPPEGHQFFGGPYDDVAPGEDTYVELYAESEYCAGCHRGVFWDTVVYDSFGEWSASPDSDPLIGQTCQDCHMPPTGASAFALPDEGGMERDPETIPGHLMPGALDEDLLRSAVTMTVSAVRRSNIVEVSVEIVNDGTGHHVPTDSPLRHLLLVVTVTGDDDLALDQVSGPVVPEWGGVGNPEYGYYAGLPGTAYAKVLEELWTEVAPSGAYWNPTRLLSDNRIPALARDVTRYAFTAPPRGEVNIDVRLFFRRAFIELTDQKDWDVPDIVMAEETLLITS